MKITQTFIKHPAVMFPLLICLIGIATAGVSTAILFNVEVENDKTRLKGVVSVQVNLMEAVARFDLEHSQTAHPDGSFNLTMQQIVNAHKSHAGFGKTGEFVIGKLIDGEIALLQNPRFDDDVNFQVPEFVPIPMQRALGGETGEIIASDYKGNQVLASYAPVGILDIGLVAKIDTDEVYQPFIVAGEIIIVLTLVMLGIGVYASRQFSIPFTELEREKKRAEKYLDIAGTIILILDKNGNIKIINRKGCEVLGYNEDQLIGKNWFEMVIPEDKCEQIKQVFARAMSGDMENIAEYINEILDVNGTPHLISWHNSYLTDRNGTISGSISAGEDITEQNKFEKALVLSQTRFNKSQEFANIGTWDWNIETGDLYWSDRIAPLFGYAKGELEITYDNFIAAIHPDDRQMVTDAVNACVEQGAEYNIEHRTLWPDGTVRWLHESGDVVRDQDGNALNMLGVVQDITERMAMQEQLIQSSKMATLGEMATGVAHELNQPLNVIRLAVGNIIKRLDKKPINARYMKEKLSKVDLMAERAASIIDHMRIFGRTTSGKMAPLDSELVVISTLDLIGEQLRMMDIEVTTKFSGNKNIIYGHQVQIEQVLLNLLSNARDSLKDTDGEKKIIVNVGQNKDNTSVNISVEDSGGGIDPKNLQRIFEPFFTTKDVGDGTGLGLSISYGIINDMGGQIEVENTPMGACFKIIMPVYKGKMAA